MSMVDIQMGLIERYPQLGVLPPTTLNHLGGNDTASLGKYFRIQGRIYGGYANGGGDTNSNLLNVKGKDLVVGNVVNFDYANFYLMDGLSAGDTILRLTNNEATTINTEQLQALIHQR